MAETPAKGEIELGARLEALREQEVDRRDPIRFAYLAALARRAADQGRPVRQWLTAKILREADELEAAGCVPQAVDQAPVPASMDSPLAELLAYIREHAVAASPQAGQHASAARPAPRPGPGNRHDPVPELKSVAYFRESWSKLSTEQQLTQTLAQAPENAGPMNSQHLVLCALKVMRDRSPDYLQGFMSYVDTLIWLEQALPMRLNAGVPRQEKAKATKRRSGKR